MLSTFRNIEFVPADTGNTRSAVIGNCPTLESVWEVYQHGRGARSDVAIASGFGKLHPSLADKPMIYAHWPELQSLLPIPLLHSPHSGVLG